MKRTEKEELVGTMAEIFKGAQAGFLVDFRGLNVEQVNDLRRRLNGAKATMRVLKNRIAKLAIEGTAFATLGEHLTDTRAFIYSDEAVEPAKAVTRYLGENEKFQFIAGVLVTGSGTSVLNAARLKALGDLPSREQLLIQLLFVMQGTQTKFVRTLNEIPAKFVRTLAALAAEREKAS